MTLTYTTEAYTTFTGGDYVEEDFGVLQPGQGAGQTLYRIMAVLPASDASPLTDDQVQAWVSQKVVQHYGG